MHPQSLRPLASRLHLAQRDDEVLSVVDVHAGGVAPGPQQAVVVEVCDLLPLQMSGKGRLWAACHCQLAETAVQAE